MADCWSEKLYKNASCDKADITTLHHLLDWRLTQIATVLRRTWLDKTNTWALQ